ncbi:amino acid permease-domain-containing protein [Cristinia sonorae]|uniref:Amino acid permease-domain-containing protein n=1 Tax=Cristinia sonorae TaxID=1940300 RepID=A0A8K0XKP3_9AGAR|nr:amino acid permease-domain-containing protein [Cristinia sonorae]
MPSAFSGIPSNGLRSRVSAGRTHNRVAFQTPTIRPTQLLRQRLRISQFQQRWENIKQDLPPQLSRRHIGMISIGGVIGTGLFLGSNTALKNGGPVGALLGYFIIGTVVYCLCVSVGEMIAFLPNVGGVVGLADLYVDPAVGFSLGWAAWYNWSVTLPTEITAAAIVVQFWDKQHQISPAIWSAIFLILATSVNLFSSRVYGEFEFWFSTVKVLTIVILIIICLIIDLGAGQQGFVGFSNWKQPFGVDYLGIKGGLGRFLGFWAVLMQASFSFFGSEVPGIAAGEVIDATRNVPRALQRVWIRITVFYVGGIFCVGLLVPANHPRLNDPAKDASSSPFVIALDIAGVKVLPHIINAAVLLSAWSAAASDVYISSRFLFFLARCHHAPQFLASLIRHPKVPERYVESEEEFSEVETDDEDDTPPVLHIARETPPPIIRITRGSESNGDRRRHKEPFFVLPLNAVLVSASVGLLSFLGSATGNTAETAFDWLVAVASVASLQSWAGILFTYIRWHQGTSYAERKYGPEVNHDPHAREVIGQVKKIREQRHWGQPYMAWYAFIICMVVLFTNGWSVFVHNGWRIGTSNTAAEIPDHPVDDTTNRVTNAIPVFLSSYVPLPFFLLLTFGYKLIHRTKMVGLDEMTFERKNVPEPEHPPEPKSKAEGIMRWLLLN